MLERLKQLVTEEKGQGMAEYGLILALIAVVVMVALGPLGNSIAAKFNEVTTKLGGSPSS
jgi:pilus assembly protein Flp/PilA